MNAEELRFLFDRIDPEHYVPLAAEARRAWEVAPCFELCYMPGDMTHYALVFTVVGRDLPLFGAPGGGSDDYPPSSGVDWKRSGEYAIVAYMQRGTAMVVGLHEFVHPERVVEGLTDNAASALAIAVLLNEITLPGDREWRDGMIEAAQAAVTPA